MNRTIVAGLLLLAVGQGCTNRNTPAGVIAEHIGKRVVIERSDSVRNFSTGEAMTYGELTARYDYLSLVYVDNDCSACRVALVEWTDKVDTVNQLASTGKYAVLFIYRGDDAGKYLKNYLDEASYFPYYVLTYHDLTFLRRNDIALQVLNSSVLMDKHSVIRLVGEPFASVGMTDLYRQTITGQMPRP